MDRNSAARVGAIGLVLCAISFAAIELAARNGSPEPQPAIAKPVSGRDPLSVELLRCGHPGDVGPPDVACLRAWAENRRRFLGQGIRKSVFPSAQGRIRQSDDRTGGDSEADGTVRPLGPPTATVQGH